MRCAELAKVQIQEKLGKSSQVSFEGVFTLIRKQFPTSEVVSHRSVFSDYKSHRKQKRITIISTVKVIFL